MSASPSARQALRFGRFRLDPARGELRKDEHPVKLQPQPLRVLALLASSRHRGDNDFLGRSLPLSHRSPTPSPAGYQPEAIALYEKAIEEDPEFALALVGLSEAHYGMGHQRERREYGRRAMEQADRLSPRERYYVEGWYYAVRVRILGAVVSGPLRNCSSSIPTTLWGERLWVASSFALNVATRPSIITRSSGDAVIPLRSYTVSWRIVISKRGNRIRHTRASKTSWRVARKVGVDMCLLPTTSRSRGSSMKPSRFSSEPSP